MTNDSILKIIALRFKDHEENIKQLRSHCSEVSSSEDFKTLQPTLIKSLMEIESDLREGSQALYTSLIQCQNLREEIQYLQSKQGKSKISDNIHLNKQTISNELNYDYSSMSKDIDTERGIINDREVVSSVYRYDQLDDIQTSDLQTPNFNTGLAGDNKIALNSNLNSNKDHIDKFNQVSSKTKRISEILVKIYSSDEFQDILTQLYGVNFTDELTSPDAKEEFISEIEETILEIQRLRDKDSLAVERDYNKQIHHTPVIEEVMELEDTYYKSTPLKSEYLSKDKRSVKNSRKNSREPKNNIPFERNLRAYKKENNQNQKIFNPYTTGKSDFFDRNIQYGGESNIIKPKIRRSTSKYNKTSSSSTSRSLNNSYAKKQPPTKSSNNISIKEIEGIDIQYTNL